MLRELWGNCTITIMILLCCGIIVCRRWGYRASTPAERQDIEITFHTILSALGKISKKEDIKSNRELSELCKEELLYFSRTFDDLRKIGAADLSLCYIMSTRRAIESIVTDMVLSYDLKNTAYLFTEQIYRSHRINRCHKL